MDEAKSRVLEELRRKRVKLWLPPYCENGVPNEPALKQLAGAWVARVSAPEQDVLCAIRGFQTHALEKLAKKNGGCLSGAASDKVVDRTNNVAVEVKLLGPGAGLDAGVMFPDRWADKVEASERSVLKMHNLSPQLRVSDFAEDLKNLLSVSQIRLIHRGTALSSEDESYLGQLLVRQMGNVPSTNGANAVLLCLVSGATTDAVDSVASAPGSTNEPQLTSEQNVINSIRRAAGRIQNSAMFEITDQHGKHVSMSRSDRLAFLTALGLHRLGRSRMDELNQSSALPFLLEADEEWNRSDGLRGWGNRVDNYGLLQLDIAWVYLQLESLSSLPDALRRLEVAEKVLRKQVHSNFVTLALVQAEMGNAVPPLAAIFVRLFLVQGVGYSYCDGDDAKAKSKERLDWAWTLCQQLRSAATDEAVERLCEAMRVSKFVAVSALRRANGNAASAAELVVTDGENSAKEERRLAQQRRLGLCENAMDYVDLGLISQLQDVLDLPSAPLPEAGGDGADWGTPWNEPNFKIAVGLLRLTDNNMEQAIDLYQNVDQRGDMILHRIARLDLRLREQEGGSIAGRKRNREPQEDDGIAVDDMALTTLLSLGVEEGMARKALKRTQNDVDTAVLWLTDPDQQGRKEPRDRTAVASRPPDAGAAPIVERSPSSTAAGHPTTPGTSAGRIPKKGEEAPSEGEELEQREGIDVNDKSELEQNRRDEETKKMQEKERKQREAERRRQEEEEAQELLERELGQVLQEGELEKEYLGNSLDEEWRFIEKYRSG